MPTMSRKTPTTNNEPSQYHHGNLREALIHASVQIVHEKGVQALTMRKLVDVVGVSRTAPYHHFKDKDALLAAVAEQGFASLSHMLSEVIAQTDIPLIKRLEKAVMGYLEFAIEHSNQYDLMFGQALWQTQEQEHFQRNAKDCFRQYVRLFELFKDQGVLVEEEDPLRLAQLMWSSLHGLAKLAGDGIFGRQNDLKDIAQYALQRFESSMTV